MNAVAKYIDEKVGWGKICVLLATYGCDEKGHYETT
jgi:hypothetical protein